MFEQETTTTPGRLSFEEESSVRFGEPLFASRDNPARSVDAWGVTAVIAIVAVDVVGDIFAFVTAIGQQLPEKRPTLDDYHPKAATVVTAATASIGSPSTKDL